MKKYAGFTLPEILLTMAIASILLLLAIPSYKHFREREHIRYISQALTQTISYARLQAVLRYQTILITEKGNRWKDGWKITTTNKNQTLRDFPAMPLEINLIIFQQRHKYLKIMRNGTTEGYNGHFEYGDTSLIFNRGGRIKIEKIKK